MTSTTFIFTRSQPRSLLSMAILNSARSRWFSASSDRTRIAQTCLGFSGRFWPTMRTLFQAGRSARMAGKLGVCVTDPPIHHALPKRQTNVDHVNILHDAALPPRSAVSPNCEFDFLSACDLGTRIAAIALPKTLHCCRLSGRWCRVLWASFSYRACVVCARAVG